MRIQLASSIIVWTAVSWGGRIGLLTSEAGAGDWLRIGGSLLIGLLAAATLLIHPMEGLRKPVLIVFAVFTVVLWIRSLVVNWAGDGSLPFKLVHTLLAIGFFALAGWAAWFAVTQPEADESEVSVSQDYET